MTRPKIGAHVSTAGGLFRAVENAKNIGAECFQIFGASPRQWYVKIPDEEEVKKFKTALQNSGLGNVYLHAAYLANLASPNKELVQKSVKSLTDHLKIADVIGAVGLIFHVGSGKGNDKLEALNQEIEVMKSILKLAPGKTKLIMENTAGGGAKIGDIEDIGYLYGKVKSERVKVCFDFAHGLESGIIEEYEPRQISKLCDALDQAVGLRNVIVLHANDSKTKYDSHHDRHQNIGEGEIGLVGFKSLAKEKRLRDKDWILEVPGFDDNGPDAKNVSILKSCF